MAKSPKKTGSLSSLNRKDVENWARKKKVEGPTAEKVLWLTRIMHALAESSAGRDFALMGGSAIVFLYRDLYRLSTDLDLDFIGNAHLGRNGQSEVDSRIQGDLEIFKSIALKLGLRFSRRGEAKPRFAQYALTYRSLYRREDQVELDVSYRYGHTVLPPVVKPWPLDQEAGVPAFKAHTFAEEELYAAKAVAMFDTKEKKRLDFPDQEYGNIHLITKRKIRHLFDVYLLAEEALNRNQSLDLAKFRNLFLLFGMTRIQGFEYFRGNSIGAYNDADIKNELRSVVPRDVHVPVADEMKWTVRKFLDRHVFIYGEREHRFMEDFRARRFRPEDLFKEGKIVSRLRNAQYYKEILERVALIKGEK